MSDHSALPQQFRDLIAAAELEAQSIFDACQRDADQLEAQAFELGVDRSGLGFSAGDIPLGLANEKRAEGAQRAAAHAFEGLVEQYWIRWNPDIESFLAELDYLWRSAHQKFGINAEVRATVRSNIQARALRMRATTAAASGHFTEHDQAIRQGDHKIKETKRPGKDRKKKASEKPFLFERISPDDPNYDLIRNSFIKSWADSHALVANGFAGKLSLSDFVDQCAATFEQGTNVHISLEDETSISERCNEIDRMAKKSIALIRRKTEAESTRLGMRNVKAAIDEFSRRVGEIAARAKEAILLKRQGRRVNQ